MTSTSKTKAEAAPEAVRIEWTRIRVRDGSVLFLFDRDITDVAAVAGGWLFRFRHDAGERSLMTTQAMTFVPDPRHLWEPKQAKPRWEHLGGLVNAAFNDRTARMPVQGGWVYLNTFATRGRALTLSLVFVPGEPAEASAGPFTGDNPAQEALPEDPRDDIIRSLP